MIHRKNKKILFFSTWSAFFLLLEPSGIFAWWFQEEGERGGGGNCRLAPPSSFAWVVLLPPLPANLFFVSCSFRVLAFFCGLFVGGFSSPLRSIKVFHCPRKRRGGRRKRYCFLPHFPSGWPLYHRKKGSSFAKSAAEKKSSNGELLLEIQNSEFDNLRHSHLPRHGKSLFTRLTWGISANKNRKPKN